MTAAIVPYSYVTKNTFVVIPVDQASTTKCSLRSKSMPSRPRPCFDDDLGSTEKECTNGAQSLSTIKPQGIEDHTTDAGGITPWSLEDDEAGTPSMTCGAMDVSALEAIRRTAVSERMDISPANSSNALAQFSVQERQCDQGRSFNGLKMAECLTIDSVGRSAPTEEVQCTIANQTSIGLHPQFFGPFMCGGLPMFAGGNQLLACSTMDASFHALGYGSMPRYMYLPNISCFGGPLDPPPSQYGQPVDSQPARLLPDGSQPYSAKTALALEETEAHRIHAVQSASLAALPHAFLPQTVRRFACESSGVCCIRWTIDAKKLRGNDKVAVSPLFELSGVSLEASLPFKMVITPMVSGKGKGGGSFGKANGQGKIQLKCEAPSGVLASFPLTFWLSVGGGRGPEALQLPRGPVEHSFAQNGIRGLPEGLEIWDFNGLLDPASQTFVVCLAVLSPWHLGIN